MPPLTAVVAGLVLVLSPGATLLSPTESPTAPAPHGSWPVRPRPAIVHYFDPPAVTWGRGHRGADLQAGVGAPVRTALPGRVSFVGRIAGVGIVVVDHGATRTTYQPVHASIRAGQPVAEGQVLGTLEWHGSHCGATACLHWGWLRGSTYLDPLLLVGAAPRPVRLLPMSGGGSGPGMSLPVGTPEPLR